MWRRLWPLAVGALGMLFVGWAASTPQEAQPVERLRQVLVELWPEYDRPEMLVLYFIRLPEDTLLPAEVALRIPARVGDPFAVAVRVSPDAPPINAAYTTKVEGEWQWVYITANALDVQLEYYDKLEREGDTRRYTFVWPGGVAVDRFVVSVQQPATATMLTLDPPEDTREPGVEGLMHFVKDFGALRAEDQIQLTVTYVKPDDVLSVEKINPPQMQATPAGGTAPAPAETGRGFSLAEQFVRWGPWVLGGLGLFLLILAGWMFWRSQAEVVPKSSASRRRRLRFKPKAPAGEPEEAEARYCPQCGTRARPGDRFCRMCGTPLR
ncbi:MAG: zinc ribbon domain-containing protein [Chloroflexi bacterium]|nr:zinc ribbon domain-containing protein [Chloroflexota bacterium]